MKKLIVLFAAAIVLLSACSKQADSTPTVQTYTPPASSTVSNPPQPADARLAAAMDANKDTVGWLTIPGTSIDAPVQQSVDNDYYLRRDALGNESFEGCYFADFECITTDMHSLSPNTIIYGHTFQDDTEQRYFAQLWKFANDAEFARTHKTIFYSTQDGMLEWEIISVGEVEATQNSLVNTATPTQAEMQELLQLAAERSIYAYDYDPQSIDKVLTLATCTSDNATRLVIVARLVTDVQSETILS